MKSNSRLPQRGTITGTVLSGDTDLLSSLGLMIEKQWHKQGIPSDDAWVCVHSGLCKISSGRGNHFDDAKES